MHYGTNPPLKRVNGRIGGSPLFQVPIFSPVDLAKFASDLDEAEKTTMAEGGFDSAEFIKFMQQPSANMGTTVAICPGTRLCF